MKKILVVAESIDIDDSSGSKATVGLIENLNKCGYKVFVYHYTRKQIGLDNIETFSIEEKRRSLLFVLSRIERKLRHNLSIDFHKTLENYFGFSFTLLNDRNSIVEALRTSGLQPDLILTVSKGGSFRPHHALLQLPQWHSKWLAYMHDPYPMHHYPKPYTWTEPGHLKKEQFIRNISKKAKHSVFPSELLKEWMGNFYPEFLKTGVIIPHQTIDLKTAEVQFPDYFDPSAFNLLHAGNLLGARNPTTLINAFEGFIRRNPEAKDCAKLFFIGGNNSSVKNRFQSENIFSSDDYINFLQVFKMQQCSAVNIILEAKSDISPFLPGKFPHCISGDRFILILGPERSEVRRLMGNDYPFWSEIDDLERMTSIIEDMFYIWKSSPEEFRLNRPDLINYLGPDHLKEVMDPLLEEQR